MPRRGSSSSSSGSTSTSDYSDDSESESDESEESAEPPRTRPAVPTQGHPMMHGAWPGRGMPLPYPGMMHPAMAGMAGLRPEAPRSPTGSEGTAETNSTELAARERARSLLLEFRETKLSLAAAQKALDVSQRENERLNQVLYEQRRLFAKERGAAVEREEQWKREKQQLQCELPDQAKIEMEELANSVIEISKEKAALAEELRLAREELEKHRAQNTDMNRAQRSQESEIQVLREALEAEKERADDGLRAIENRYEARLHELEQAQQDSERMKAVESRKNALEEEVHTLEREVQVLRGEANKAQMDAHRADEEVMAAKKAIESLAAELDRERERGAEREQYLLRVQVERDEALRAAQQERESGSALQQRLAEAEGKLLATQQALDSIQAMQKETAERDAYLEQELQLRDNQQRQEVEQLVEQIQVLKDELAASQEKTRQMQSVAAVARLHRQADDANGQRMCEKLKRKIDELQQRLVESDKEVAGLKKQVAKEERKHSATKARLEEAERGHRETQKQLQDIIADHEKVLNVVERLKDEKSSLKQQREQLKQSLGERANESAALARERDEVRKDKVELQDEVRALRQQLTDLARANENMVQSLREAEQRRLEVERQRDGLGNAVKSAADKNQREQAEIRRRLEEQEEALAAERIALQEAMHRQEQLFAKERQALQEAAQRREETARVEQDRDRLELQRKCYELEARLQAMERQGSPTIEQHHYHHRERDRDRDSDRDREHVEPDKKEQRQHVHRLAGQLEDKDKELLQLRCEMDALRQIVEDTRRQHHRGVTVTPPHPKHLTPPRDRVPGQVSSRWPQPREEPSVFGTRSSMGTLAGILSATAPHPHKRFHDPASPSPMRPPASPLTSASPPIR
eukprot:Sspe_Gene.32894::Locus_16107_Transcript_1_1_Confidence_1.000_Length_2798::g.32894::m.32894